MLSFANLWPNEDGLLLYVGIVTDWMSDIQISDFNFESDTLEMILFT